MGIKNKYISNLVRNLIGKNKFVQVVERLRGKETDDGILTHIKIMLEIDEVAMMNSETLGRIMCSFEECDVPLVQKEIAKHTHFNGDCREFMREVVALFLAAAILNELGNR